MDEKFYSEREFVKENFSEQHFSGVEFYKCKFINSNFYKTSFTDCQFENCSFEKTELSLMTVGTSRFLDVSFNNCKMIGIDWTVLKKPYRFSFKECKLDNCSFYKMDLNGLLMEECSVREADFIEANLTKASFPYTDLYHTRFNGANLSFANFSNALNYYIDPNLSKFKKTIFTLPEAINLLNGFDIVIK